MNEEKKVPFKWEYGEETISLQLECMRIISGFISA